MNNEFMKIASELDVSRITSDQYCFGILKPDAIEAGIAPDIRQAIGAAGLRVTYDQPNVQLEVADVITIWTIASPYTSRTVPYMTSGPVDLFIVEGAEASDRMLGIKRDFRSRYPSENPVVSVMHSTDHDAELVRCVDHFFGSKVGAAALNTRGAIHVL
jgi:nucleoside diphosphate kinase